MKYSVTLVSLIIGCILFVSAGNAREITLYGDDSYPPYSFKGDDGKPAGIYVDIIQRAFEKIDEFEAKIEAVPWRRGLQMVKTGNGLAIFPPYYAKERLKFYIYSEPLLEEETVIFGKAEKMDGKNKWPEDYFGSLIGLNTGFNPSTMGKKAFVEAINAGKIQLDDSGDSNEQNLKKLVSNRLDFYINDRMINISAYPEIQRGITVNTNNGHLMFTKNIDKYPFIPELMKKFNKIVSEMKLSGEIESIASSYIGKQ